VKQQDHNIKCQKSQPLLKLMYDFLQRKNMKIIIDSNSGDADLDENHGHRHISLFQISK